MTEKCEHLTPREQENLLKLKYIYEYMFDGTLGMCNTALYDLELKDDAKPV